MKKCLGRLTKEKHSYFSRPVHHRGLPREEDQEGVEERDEEEEEEEIPPSSSLAPIPILSNPKEWAKD